jgi:hypothetical protein
MGKPELLEIPLTLHLSKDAGTKLEERASAAGKPLAAYIETLLETFIEAPRSWEEISGPVYQRFLESGTSDEALSEELEKAKHEMRAERHSRQAS